MYTPFAHAINKNTLRCNYVILYWFSFKIILCTLYSVTSVEGGGGLGGGVEASLIQFLHRTF